MGREFIKRADGSDAVVLDRADYDRLVSQLEDLEDELHGQRVTPDAESIRSGAAEAFSSDVIDAFFEASSPLAFWREYRALSIEALASNADVSAVDIIRIESGEPIHDARAFSRLATALDLPAELILPR